MVPKWPASISIKFQNVKDTIKYVFLNKIPLQQHNIIYNEARKVFVIKTGLQKHSAPVDAATPIDLRIYPTFFLSLVSYIFG